MKSPCKTPQQRHASPRIGRKSRACPQVEYHRIRKEKALDRLLASADHYRQSRSWTSEATTDGSASVVVSPRFSG